MEGDPDLRKPFVGLGGVESGVDQYLGLRCFYIDRIPLTAASQNRDPYFNL
jgi:hypothetical protein